MKVRNIVEIYRGREEEVGVGIGYLGYYIG